MRNYATSLKGKKRIRRLEKKYPKNIRQKMEPLTSQAFEPQSLTLSEPQIMYQADTPGFDPGLLNVLKTPYLTSNQPSDALSVMLYQQHLLNIAQGKRESIRKEYLEDASIQGRFSPQILSGRYNWGPEDYARVYEQRLVKAWGKRNWFKTLKIVDEMEKLNIPLLRTHYEAIIGNLIDCGEYPRSEYFVDQMIENQIQFTPSLLEKLIQGCLHENNLTLAKKYLGILSDSGLIFELQGYIYLMKLYLKNGQYDLVQNTFNELQEIGHSTTEECWILLMKSKALQGDTSAVESLILEAGNDDFPVSTSMLNEVFRSIDAQERDSIFHFFKHRYEEEKLERDVGTYEIILQKLLEVKDFESLYFYYNDFMEHVINPPFVKPSDELFLIALKATQANNFDSEKTEEIWRDMKRMDSKRKYNPNWKKPNTMKESLYYKIKARYSLDGEHHKIISHVRKIAWVRNKLSRLEKSEDDYQRRKAIKELRLAADKGGIAYATYDGEDFIPLAQDEIESIKNATRAK